MSLSFEKFVFLKNQKNSELDIRIITDSMAPWIMAGAYTKVKIIGIEDIEPWDIVVFWKKDILICHIFFKREGDVFYTFPLNRNEKLTRFDEPNPVSHLLGVVIDPKFGFLQKLYFKWKSRKILKV